MLRASCMLACGKIVHDVEILQTMRCGYGNEAVRTGIAFFERDDAENQSDKYEVCGFKDCPQEREIGK